MYIIFNRQFNKIELLTIIFSLYLICLAVLFISIFAFINLSEHSRLIPFLFSPASIFKKDFNYLKDQPAKYYLSEKYHQGDKNTQPTLCIWKHQYIIDENVKGPIFFVENHMINNKNLANQKINNEDFANQKIVIHFPGITRTTIKWEEHALKEIPSKWNQHHHGFINYPGGLQNVSQAIDVGVRTIQYFLDKGYKMKNMTIKGHSMGGAVATLAINQFKDKPKRKFEAFYHVASFRKSSAVRKRFFEYFIFKATRKLWDIFPDKVIFNKDLPVKSIHILGLKQDDIIKYDASMHIEFEKQVSKNKCPEHIYGHLFDNDNRKDNIGENEMKHTTPGLILNEYFEHLENLEEKKIKFAYQSILSDIRSRKLAD